MKKLITIVLLVLAIHLTTSQYDDYDNSRPGKGLSDISLDSHSGKCFTRRFRAEGGKINISFNYRVNPNRFRESAVVVTIDDVEIERI